MKGYAEETYGERIADIFDQWYSTFDPAAIQALAELSHGGKALELGIGTGRIAIPLMQAGVDVSGIDISPAMVAQLRSKPGGEGIPVSMGSFAEMEIAGKFSLIYVVFNTFYSLLTQEEQVKCIKNAASHLEQDGVFVLEVFVPDLTRFSGKQAVRAARIGDNSVQIDVSEIEPEKQIITSQHMLLTEQGTKFYPVSLRYVWASEMDLMAQLAGMKLRERWSDWKRNPFTSDSRMHISIYELQ